MYDILLLEDDLDTIRLTRAYFESKGVRLKGVGDGYSFFNELKRFKPKLILTDIIHPGPNGYEVCKQIKSNDEFKQIPVFFFTAQPWSEVRRHMEGTGADGYILKPFNFSDFDILFNYLK